MKFRSRNLDEKALTKFSRGSRAGELSKSKIFQRDQKQSTD